MPEACKLHHCIFFSATRRVQRLHSLITTHSVNLLHFSPCDRCTVVSECGLNLNLATDIELLFMCLYAIHIISFGEISKSFACFYWVTCFLIIENYWIIIKNSWKFFIYSECRTFIHMWFYMFTFSPWLVFLLAYSIFQNIQFLILMKSTLSFSFLVWIVILVLYLNILCLILGHKFFFYFLLDIW